MRQPPRLLTILLLCVAAYGCSSEKWVHRYKKPNELVYDYNSCERQIDSYQSSGARSVQITPYVRRGMIDQCLHKIGWFKKSEQ
jgi:hypothetical protein